MPLTTPARRRNGSKGKQKVLDSTLIDNSTPLRGDVTNRNRRASFNDGSADESKDFLPTITGNGGVDQSSRSPKRTLNSTLPPIVMPDVPQYSRPQTYSSLPPSPIQGSPIIGQQMNDHEGPSSPRPLSSLWDYLCAEVLTVDADLSQDIRWERVSNFLSVPLAVEKIILFGFFLCMDSFLHVFTILPLRCCVAITRLVPRCLPCLKSTPVSASQKADIMRVLLVLIPVLVLLPNVDVSKVYHSIRGQDTIKLYVIFNALEIADRLFTSFGEDLMDCLFARATLSHLSLRGPLSSHKLQPVFYFLMTVICVGLHALMLIYQLTSLNVAINSFDQSLLTLLVSNQFVEIKGSVFKRFEKDNLFQITCADIVERFQLSLMLLVVAFRVMVELSGTEFDGSMLPKSFVWVRGGSMLWTIAMPVIIVLLSEVFVDWLKHAFITKFNHIRPSIYERYTDILCRDLLVGSHWSRAHQKHLFIDQAPFVTRRLGLATLPLSVVAVLVCSQALGASTDTTFSLNKTAQWSVLCLMIWFCAIVLKIMFGIQLVMFAIRRHDGMKIREEEDVVNDYGRSPIGESVDEKMRTSDIKRMLAGNEFSSSAQSRNQDTNSKPVKKQTKLEAVTRFTMTKRIW